MTKQGLTREIILDTAAELADSEGLDKLSLKTLAERLEVKTPSLYNHIDGLPGLHVMLAVRGLEQLNARITEAVSGLTGDSAVYTIGRTYITFARRHPGLYTAIRLPNLQEREEVRALQAGISQTLAGAMAGYRLQEPIVTHMVRLLLSLLHGFADLEKSGNFPPPVNRDDTFLAAMACMLAGIHANYTN